ncbi:hypothetical protein Tco_0223873 [Tanacetum coccineum]
MAPKLSLETDAVSRIFLLVSLFTWMNKEGTKLSKLDRFLISEGCDSSLQNGLLDSNLKCHEKFRRLKDKIKQWSNNIKTLERNRKTVTLEEINSIEKRIDEGSAMPSDNDHRLIILQEIEKIDKFASMDIIQKAHVKWNIEGNGHEPCLIKDAFFQFYKKKFQAQDSQYKSSEGPDGLLFCFCEGSIGALLQKIYMILLTYSLLLWARRSSMRTFLFILVLWKVSDNAFGEKAEGNGLITVISLNYLGLPIGTNMKSIATLRRVLKSFHIGFPLGKLIIVDWGVV